MASLINPSNIDITYPIAGQDNDTQGFRDNFNNIKNNLTTAKTEISDLQSAFGTLYGNANVVAYLSTSNVTISNLTVTSNANINGNITATGITLTSAIQFANLSTTQINAIGTLSRGMTVYNYSTGNIQVYNGTKWANITLS
jgi:hypothetical protein